MSANIYLEGQAPVTHACNPSYSGGRDQEDRSSKPAWANSSQDPISKQNPSQNKVWRSGSTGTDSVLMVPPAPPLQGFYSGCFGGETGVGLGVHTC
jgi:hypothetical protein